LYLFFFCFRNLPKSVSCISIAKLCNRQSYDYRFFAFIKEIDALDMCALLYLIYFALLCFGVPNCSSVYIFRQRILFGKSAIAAKIISITFILISIYNLLCKSYLLTNSRIWLIDKMESIILKVLPSMAFLIWLLII
jgi:hypothetical protein